MVTMRMRKQPNLKVTWKEAGSCGKMRHVPGLPPNYIFLTMAILDKPEPIKRRRPRSR
jgi:hypothetical protein